MGGVFVGKGSFSGMMSYFDNVVPAVEEKGRILEDLGLV